MDLVTTSVGGKASKISGTFSGSDSYWYGDEYSSRNLSALVLFGLDLVGSMGDSENPITLADGSTSTLTKFLILIREFFDSI